MYSKEFYADMPPWFRLSCAVSIIGGPRCHCCVPVGAGPHGGSFGAAGLSLLATGFTAITVRGILVSCYPGRFLVSRWNEPQQSRVTAVLLSLFCVAFWYLSIAAILQASRLF